MKNCSVTVIDKSSPYYQKSREISNLLLLNDDKLSPDEIAYYESAEDVKCVLNHCQQNNKLFRIRSGGHHHEGACTADNVIIIDTSRMNKMVIDTTTNTVIIPSGTKLKEVYKELTKYELVIPGGGCDSVAIGGLAQGGGWGPYSRLYGMTCDSLVSAQIVIADGKVGFKIVDVNNKNEYKDLFKALKGSGGGNFGVVTSLTFKTQSLVGLKKVSFYIQMYDEEKPQYILNKWFENASQATNVITSFARVYPKGNNLHLYVSGIIIARKNDSEQVIKKQIATIIDVNFPIEHIKFEANALSIQNDTLNSENFTSIENSISSDVFINDILETQGKQVPAAPTSTCDEPHPHKISSFFPKKGIDYTAFANAIFEYMNKDHGFGNKLNCYLSLHGMGGKIKDGDNYFYYKDRDFMLQIQAWWSEPKDPDNNKYLAWVENLRLELSNKGFTEGCFVNFPDYNCIRKFGHMEKYDPTNDNDRIKLLLQFYKKTYLIDLLKIKQKYDSKNLFLHEMSLKSGFLDNLI